MQGRRGWWLGVALVLGCNARAGSGGSFDAGDTGGADLSAQDTGAADQATADTGAADSGTVDGATPDVVPVDSGGCGAGLARCGGACVDLATSGAHCGACDRPCPTGQSCRAGTCQAPPSDCRTAPCPSRSYCDLGTGTCRPGCIEDAQCGTRERCDTVARACVCATDAHRCGEACASNRAVETCGASCSPCPAGAHGTPSCDGTRCGLSCDAGYHLCGGACVSDASVATCGASCSPCPTGAHGTPTCEAGRCGLACDAGYHLCGGACVSDTSVATCGASCTPCPSGGGTPTCVGGRCGVSCPSGQHACSGVCVSDTSVASCGTSCTPCPTSPGATARCEAGSCRITCGAPSFPCATGCCSVMSSPLAGTAGYGRPALSIDGTDRLHLFLDRAGVGGLYLTAPLGGTWTSETVGGLTPTGLALVTGRADTSGRPVACGAYNFTSGDPAWRLECARREGGVWRPVGSTTHSTERVVTLEVAPSPGGNFGVLVGEDIRGSSGSPRHRLARWNGTAFDLSATPSGGAFSAQSMLTFSPSGVPLVLYAPRYGSCLALYELTGTAWASLNVGSPCVDGRYGALVVGPDDTRHVVYSTSYGNALYARRTGTAWSLETIQTTSITWVTDFNVALDRTGNVHAVWVREGVIGYGVRVGGSWLATSGIVSGVSPAMVVDSRGGVHLVYRVDSTQPFLYAHW